MFLVTNWLFWSVHSFYEKSRQRRTKRKIMLEIVATDIVASRPTGTPIARVKIWKGVILKLKSVILEWPFPFGVQSWFLYLWNQGNMENGGGERLQAKLKSNILYPKIHIIRFCTVSPVIFKPIVCFWNKLKTDLLISTWSAKPSLSYIKEPRYSAPKFGFKWKIYNKIKISQYVTFKFFL